MFFLLRMAFWLGVVCVLLPSGGPRGSAPDAQIDAKEAVTLASAAVSDMRGFCGRQPNACVVGGKVVSAIGHKAEAGARTLYQLISAQFDKPAAAPPSDKMAAKVADVPAQDRGTLTASDMQPAWHAPVPLPPRREARRPAA
jgi:Family of unknown function (DUF5330)